MYLRRKVFSYQPSLEDIINEVEERAFCEGYEQRMFDEEAEKEKKKSHTSNIVGVGLAGAGLGVSGAALANRQTFRDGIDAIRNHNSVNSTVKKLRGRIKDSADQQISKVRNAAITILKNKDVTGHISAGNTIIPADEFRSMSSIDRTKLLDKAENNIKESIKEQSKLSNLGRYAEGELRAANAVGNPIAIKGAKINLHNVDRALARNKMLKIAGGVAAGTGLASAGLAALHYKNKDKNKD